MLCQAMRLDLPGAHHSTSTPVSKMPTPRRGTQTHSFHTHWPVEERAPKSSGSYPEALGSSRKPFCEDFVLALLHRGSPRSSEKLPEATRKIPEAPGSSQKPFCKDFVLVLLRRGGPRSPAKLPEAAEVPKGAQTHSAHNAHRSSSQCSLEKTTVLTVLILNNNNL